MTDFNAAKADDALPRLGWNTNSGAQSSPQQVEAVGPAEAETLVATAAKHVTNVSRA